MKKKVQHASVNNLLPLFIILNRYILFLSDEIISDTSIALDLIEISGGCYEHSAMMTGIGTSTAQREAYFLDFAESIRQLVAAKSKAAFMVTGGFRSASVMLEALRSGAVDVIGLGRPFIMQPLEIAKLLTLDNEKSSKFSFVDAKLSTGIKDFDAGIQVSN